MNANSIFLGGMAILATVPFCTQNVAAQKSMKKPNVVVILADDLGYGDLGCYGRK